MCYFTDALIDISCLFFNTRLMPINSCQFCKANFYAKPSHIKKGWGKYCSKLCQSSSKKTGNMIDCFICKKPTYKNLRDQQRSVSSKFFCSKSCQTIWRNTQYSGDKHSNWTGGKSSYRVALLRSSLKQACGKCTITDKRVLAVHHKDKNRWNNDLSNLMWLCHNCHYLVHHDKREAEGFLVPVA
ncbi:MAG: hypothetical protein JWO47_315 [Candidatus Saccharibacteria bacterium]|nr:hypothetical protein [Candidatus Saccharibacteria bacterium]